MSDSSALIGDDTKMINIVKRNKFKLIGIFENLFGVRNMVKDLDGKLTEIEELVKRQSENFSNFQEEVELKYAAVKSDEISKITEGARLRLVHDVQQDVFSIIWKRVWIGGLIVIFLSFFGIRTLIELSTQSSIYQKLQNITTNSITEVNGMRSEVQAMRDELAKELVELKEITKNTENARLISEISQRVNEWQTAIDQAEENIVTADESFNRLTEWVFLSRVEALYKQSRLLSQISTRNPEMKLPYQIPELQELNENNKLKIVLFIPRRAKNTYPKRTALGYAVVDDLVLKGYNADPWISGVKDDSQIELSADLQGIESDLGGAEGVVAANCLENCIIFPNLSIISNKERERLVETVSASLGREVSNVTSATMKIPVRFRKSRDYSRAFPKTKAIPENLSIIIVLSSI